MPITTKIELRRLISEAERSAAMLRHYGMAIKSRGERERIAQMITDLCEVARRAFDPDALRELRESD